MRNSVRATRVTGRGNKLATVAGLMVILAGNAAFADGASAPLTLAEAWHVAESDNPDLRRAQAQLAAAEGQVADTRTPLWNNPEASGEWVHRRGRPDAAPGSVSENWEEWNAAIRQTFEVAGQQGFRREAAIRERGALQAEIQETRLALRANVEASFVRVLSLQTRLDNATEGLRLLEEATTMAERRVAAGEDNRLDGNLARVELERGRNELSVLREALLDARGELAVILQLEPSRLPEVAGILSPPAKQYTLQELLDSAASRPKLQALGQREDAAASRLKLERSAAYPDLTVGLSGGREGPAQAEEDLVGVSVSVPLPLFRRNATGIGRASSDLTDAQIATRVSRRDVEAEIRLLWQKVASLRGRVGRLETELLPSLDANRQLSMKAYRAGEIGLPQLLLVSRQMLDARRDLDEARTELRLAVVALEAGAGWTAHDASQ